MPDAPFFSCLNDGLVTYQESAYQETSFRQEGQTAVRHCQLDGALEERFERAMLGWTTYDGTNGLLLRNPPETHPRKPWLIARAVDFVRQLGEPTFTGPGGSLQFNTIEMAVTYEATPGTRWLADALVPEGVDHEGWRNITYREEADIENRIIPNNTLKFNDLTDTPVPNPGVQLVASSNVFIQWFQVPAIIDFNGVPQLPGQLAINHANCQGHVNSVPFFNAAPLTLYCTAPKKELVTMADGNLAWNFTFMLLRRGGSHYPTVAVPTGDLAPNANETEGPNWNRLIQPNGKYRRVYRTSDGTKTQSIYLTADLYDLFRVGTDDIVVILR